MLPVAMLYNADEISVEQEPNLRTKLNAERTSSCKI